MNTLVKLVAMVALLFATVYATNFNDKAGQDVSKKNDFSKTIEAFDY